MLMSGGLMVTEKVTTKVLSKIMLTIACMAVMPCTALAQYNEYNQSSERSTAARGHYAHARAHLVRALEEFEIARKLSRPDLLLDSEEWRLSVVSRTEELNRVLDPQPRVTRSGVRFKADGLVVTRQAKQAPAVDDGARDSNDVNNDIRGDRQSSSYSGRGRYRSKYYSQPSAGEPLADEPVDPNYGNTAGDPITDPSSDPSGSNASGSGAMLSNEPAQQPSNNTLQDSSSDLNSNAAPVDSAPLSDIEEAQRAAEMDANAPLANDYGANTSANVPSSETPAGSAQLETTEEAPVNPVDSSVSERLEGISGEANPE